MDKPVLGAQYSPIMRKNPPEGMGTVLLGRGGTSNFFPWVLAFYPSNCYLSNCFIRNYVGSTGIRYNCAQQHYQHEKALFFDDAETADEILKCFSPKKQKALGRKIKNFDTRSWDLEREAVMHRVIFEKFSSDLELRTKLLSLDPRLILAESSAEKFWGTGIYFKDAPETFDNSNWTGENKLGKILMDVSWLLEKKKNN